MAVVEPVSLRFVRPEWADEVPSPPHDALSPEARRQHLMAHPRSYLGVTRAPEDADVDHTDPTTSPSSGRNRVGEALAAGRAALEEMLADGVFGPEVGPAFYLYRLEHGDHRQTGLVCGVATEDYDRGTIRIHEQINRERAAHLTRHLQVVGAQSSPIAMAFATQPAVERIIAHTVQTVAPFLDFTDADGLRQQLWEIADDDDIERINTAFGGAALYLIDGHHRAAAASADRQDHDIASRDRRLMLSTLFPVSELRSQAFHRLLRGIDTERLVTELVARFPTRSTGDPQVVVDRAETELALATPQAAASPDRRAQWLLLDIPFDADDRASLHNIDPVRLRHHVLQPLLGIDEVGADSRLSYRPGPSDLAAIEGLKLAEDEALFLMRPVSMDTLIQVSDQGLVMPPKSTYFEPKVRSGLFVRLLDWPGAG